MLVLKRSRDSAVRCRRCHTIIFRRTLYPSRVTRDSAPVDLSLQLVKDALTFNGRRRQGFGCDELRNAFIRLLPAIRSLERRARYLFYCMFVCLFVCLFGQRVLDNPRDDSRQSSHAGVLWFRMCLLPFWGLAALGGRKKGQMKFSLLWESMGNFCILAVFERYLSNASRIHTKYYLCSDNVCRRAPSPCDAHRPLGGGGRGS